MKNSAMLNITADGAAFQTYPHPLSVISLWDEPHVDTSPTQLYANLACRNPQSLNANCACITWR
jgi:hypothetical protein